jgi:hypothetical protein
MLSQRKRPSEQKPISEQTINSIRGADVERAIAASNRAGNQSWDTVVLKLLKTENEAKKEPAKS